MNLKACAVRERTGDGRSVGRCWFNVVDGKCPRHGDVAAVQKRFAERGELTDELDLEAKPNDIEKLIERLRAHAPGPGDSIQCEAARLLESLARENARLAARQDDRAELMVSLGHANLENVRLAAALDSIHHENCLLRLAGEDVTVDRDLLAAENARLEEANIHLTDDTGETWESQCLRARAERDALRVAANHLSESHFTVERQRDRLKAENAELRERMLKGEAKP